MLGFTTPTYFLAQSAHPIRELEHVRFMSNIWITPPLLVTLFISVISFSSMLIQSLYTGWNCLEPEPCAHVSVTTWLADMFPGLTVIKNLLWMREMCNTTAISDITDLSNQNALSVVSSVREQKVEPNKPLAYNCHFNKQQKHPAEKRHHRLPV